MNDRPRIVEVGSANVDLTTFTNQFPRLGETIFAPAFHLGFGGKGANPAVAVCRCVAEVTPVARVGDDLFGPARWPPGAVKPRPSREPISMRRSPRWRAAPESSFVARERFEAEWRARR